MTGNGPKGPLIGSIGLVGIYHLPTFIELILWDQCTVGKFTRPMDPMGWIQTSRHFPLNPWILDGRKGNKMNPKSWFRFSSDDVTFQMGWFRSGSSRWVFQGISTTKTSLNLGIQVTLLPLRLPHTSAIAGTLFGRSRLPSLHGGLDGWNATTGIWTDFFPIGVSWNWNPKKPNPNPASKRQLIGYHARLILYWLIDKNFYHVPS